MAGGVEIHLLEILYEKQKKKNGSTIPIPFLTETQQENPNP
jgi:hypothetical protein